MDSPSKLAVRDDSADDVIVVEDFQKKYGDFEAVKGISFAVRRGEIFGLIGPDGAGKTSTFHVLGGVLNATSGKVVILSESPRNARKRVGYLTQQFSLHLDLSIAENLAYSAGVREVSEADYRARSEKYLKLMSLYQFQDRLAGQLSGGMKQKLFLCCALVSAPEILLLDEPTTGVDPVSRREFWDVLAEVAAEGVTIAVATPYLDEAERCNRVALIHQGSIVDIGTPRELIDKLHLYRLELRSENMDQLEDVLTRSLNEHSPLSDVQEFGDHLEVLVKSPDEGRKVIAEVSQAHKLSPPEVELSEPSLENVFVLELKGSKQDVGEYREFDFKGFDNHKEGSVAIGADDIAINFGSFQAVKGVSIEIGYGEIFGLLGANGAGKTTTIKMLCGLLRPSRGTMTLAGERSNLRSPDLRRRIGYMSQKFTLYDDLSIMENLQFYCGVYEVPRKERRNRIYWVLETCGLRGQESLITGSLPGGWKQRLSFGASVMHQPEILFLDEPTSGVDPLARRQLWRLMRQFARNGTAILVTTHFLDEAEHCQRLAFMVSGEIVAQGTPSEIKRAQPGKVIEVVTMNPAKAARIVRSELEAWRVGIFANSVRLTLDDEHKQWPSLETKLRDGGVAVESVRTIRTTLEDAFISTVQRASASP